MLAAQLDLAEQERKFLWEQKEIFCIMKQEKTLWEIKWLRVKKPFAVFEPNIHWYLKLTLWSSIMRNIFLSFQHLSTSVIKSCRWHLTPENGMGPGGERENHLHLEVSVFTENPFAIREKRYEDVPRIISVVLGLMGLG